MVNVKIYKDPWCIDGQTLSSCPNCGRKLNPDTPYSYCPECMCNFVIMEDYHPKDRAALQKLMQSLGTPWFTNWSTFEKVMKSLDVEDRKSLRNAARRDKVYVGPLRHYRYYRYFICRRLNRLRSVSNILPTYQDQVAYIFDQEDVVIYRRRPKPPKWKPAETFEEWGLLNFGPAFNDPAVNKAAKQLWEDSK